MTVEPLRGPGDQVRHGLQAGDGGGDGLPVGLTGGLTFGPLTLRLLLGQEGDGAGADVDAAYPAVALDGAVGVDEGAASDEGHGGCPSGICVIRILSKLGGRFNAGSAARQTPWG